MCAGQSAVKPKAWWIAMQSASAYSESKFHQVLTMTIHLMWACFILHLLLEGFWWAMRGKYHAYLEAWTCKWNRCTLHVSIFVNVPWFMLLLLDPVPAGFLRYKHVDASSRNSFAPVPEMEAKQRLVISHGISDAQSKYEGNISYIL